MPQPLGESSEVQASPEGAPCANPGQNPGTVYASAAGKHTNEIPAPSPAAGRPGEGGCRSLRVTEYHPSLTLPVEGREPEEAESKLRVQKRRTITSLAFEAAIIVSVVCLPVAFPARTNAQAPPAQPAANP